MSLESRIEALTVAIEKLTEVIINDVQKGSSQLSFDFSNNEVEQVKEDVKSEPEFVTEGVDVNDVEQVDHEAFKQACLTVARSGKKDAVKAVIESYGVKKSVDVPSDKLAEALARVEAL